MNVINFNKKAALKKFPDLEKCAAKMKDTLLKVFPDNNLGFIGFMSMTVGKFFVIKHLQQCCKTLEEFNILKSTLQEELLDYSKQVLQVSWEG